MICSVNNIPAQVQIWLAANQADEICLSFYELINADGP